MGRRRTRRPQPRHRPRSEHGRLRLLRPHPLRLAPSRSRLPRTAAEQWHALHHIGPGYQAPGDLVSFQGSGGSPNHPGHVDLVLDTNRMIETLRTGLRVRISRYTTRQDITGYARPRS
ncbi:NlpC/P60 family protein [Nonomuraea diastatica]|uniref:NlpC/P60 family protein n=1 Tax=Nonomuraea diastatica TaxID=1848329 RepID=UPI003CCC61DA